MKKILVYEDGNVNVYKPCYDQEYMNISLEEYRKYFSLLRKGKMLLQGECSCDVVKRIFPYFTDIIDFTISVDSADDSNVSLDFIGSIDPVGYSIFKDANGDFCLDNLRVNAFVAWYESIGQDMRKRMFPVVEEVPVNDYYGYNERERIEDNISTLLDGVCLRLVDKIEEPNANEIYSAKKGSVFVEKFGIEVEEIKQLKK